MGIEILSGGGGSSAGALTVRAGTFAARPAFGAAVNVIYEATDTGAWYYSDGASWATIVAGGGPFVPTTKAYAAAGTDVLTAKVGADAFSRFVLNADGSMEWGGGAAATDVGWFRIGAHDLRIERPGGGTVDLELSGNLSVENGVNITAGGAAIADGATVTNGDLRLASDGNTIGRTEGGPAATQGTTALVGGTVVVNTTSADNAKRVLYSVRAPGGVQGILSCTVIDGTSLTFTSTSGADTSVINWEINDVI